MQWLNKIVEEAIAAQSDGEILVESGISPSGNYHMGYLREILICDAIVTEAKRRGRDSRHVHFVDDQDGFRKVPAGLPPEYEKYLGKPLCDMPAPDGSDQSYADYLLKEFTDSVKAIGVEMDVIRSHEKYRSGFFTDAIELVLAHLNEAKEVLETVSGRKLDDKWSPIQVNEDGYLKKRPFVGIDTQAKIISYLDKDGIERKTAYDKGQVKLDWRLDWPARWWILKVNVEPFGRDHATKGGSYDTGAALMDKIFRAPAPMPVPYEFINRAGDTIKMSASKGNGITMAEVTAVLPPEVIRYFVLRMSPDKTLFFDPTQGVVRLIDEFAELLARPDKTADDKQLIDISTKGLPVTVSSVPFSHLVAAYQSSLKDVNKTIEVIKRTNYGNIAAEQVDTIKAELKFIDKWLQKWAPEDVKFELRETIEPNEFSEEEKEYLARLSEKIVQAPENADGEWFHKAIYEFRESTGFEPKRLFEVLYRALIGKDSGPRAGWFLSILPRDWLVKRLRLEN
jgi:lysyl-tRNA synthetase class 1